MKKEKNQNLACLKPHPKFELVLRCTTTNEIVDYWNLNMVSSKDDNSKMISPEIMFETITESMNEYDGKLPCNCENCSDGERK
jgi:hypothetical protein